MGIVLTLVAIIAGATAISNKIAIPDPVLVTIVGILLGYVPGFPEVHLDPELVLIIILPPLVYYSALALPWDEFRANLRPISFYAVGLVLFTAAVVAFAAHHLVPALTWPEAFVLGAVISPTDVVASAAVTERLGAPRRVVAIIQGEGLVNDAIALTLLRLAITGITMGKIPIVSSMVRFAVIVAGEPIYGLLVGWIAAELRKSTDDSRIEIAISLLTPFAAYLVPERLGGSGVLATVAAGMYISVKTPELVPSGIRLRLSSVWDVLVYLLEGMLFLLTGMEFRHVLTGVDNHPGGQLLLYGAVIAAVVIALRYAWTWPTAWATHRMAGSSEQRMPDRHLVFLASCGMRGGISLAAALSVPAEVPGRALIVFITAAVIAGTLILEGSPLPFLLRGLKLDQDARRERDSALHIETEARAAAIWAALEALEKHGNAARHVRERYRHQLAMLREGGEEGETAAPWNRKELARMNLDGIAAERKTVIALHRKGNLPEHVLHRIERDLDLTEVRIRNMLSDGTTK